MDDTPVDNSRGPSGEPFPRAPSLLGAASRTSSYATHGTPTNCDRQNRRQQRPGRGGAFRCDQCRRAKRGLQVVSLKTSVNRKCDIDMSDERSRCFPCVNRNLPCSPRSWPRERTELNQQVEGRNRMAVANNARGSSRGHGDRFVPTLIQLIAQHRSWRITECNAIATGESLKSCRHRDLYRNADDPYGCYK